LQLGNLLGHHFNAFFLRTVARKQGARNFDNLGNVGSGNGKPCGHVNLLKANEQVCHSVILPQPVADKYRHEPRQLLA
jgi:hypothetical protein